VNLRDLSRRVDWYVLVPLLGPVLLWILGGRDFLIDPPGYVDTFGMLGRFWHYAEQNPSFEEYKTSRLPLILPGFVLHRLFEPLAAEQILHLTTLVASSMGLYFLLRDSLKDRTAAGVTSAAWSCYTWIHGDGGWNYQVGAASAYHIWGLWALARSVTAPVPRVRGWALAAGALLACAVHTHLIIAGFVPIAVLLYAAAPADSLRAAIERARRGIVWALVGGVGVTGLLALINVAVGGRWMFFMPQFEEMLSRSTGNPWFRKAALWISSAGNLIVPSLILAAGVLWLFTALRRHVRGEQPTRFAAVFVCQGLMAFALMLSLQFVAQQPALDPSFFAYPLYTQVFPVLGVVLASSQPNARPSLWLAAAAALVIVVPLLLLFPVAMPTYVARFDAWLGVASSVTQLVPLTIGGVAVLAMAWQGHRARIATFAVVYGVLNAWVCVYPNQYGLRTSGINRDTLAVITSLDRYTARLDPSLFGVRYWRERAVVQGPHGPFDLYSVADGFLSTRRRSLLTVAYDRQQIPMEQLELGDLYSQRCLGVLSEKDKHGEVVTRMTRHFEGLGFPLTEIGRHETASGPISVALTVLMVPTAGPCTACAPTDADIQRDVEKRMAGDRRVVGQGISASVNGCVVSLSGRTESQKEQEQALTLARSTPGVVRVENEILLHNVDLAQRVRAALTADAIVGRIPISVDAFGGEVRLTSDQTDQAARTRAVNVASSVAGVTHVTDDMR
jgi:osmotically-inducible protein OsmY